MKKYIFILSLLIHTIGIAQVAPNYPTAPPPSGNINAVEYFIDNKPEFGSGTILPGTPLNTDINGFIGTVTLNALPQGFHRIYFRSKDVNGTWSLTNNTFFDNYTVPVYASAPSTTTNITNIEYFVDTKPEFGTGTALLGYPTSTDINNYTANANITALPSGFHRFYIRSKDANGAWSLTNNAFFDNYSIPLYNVAPAAPVNIVQLEYFIDTYKPFGNATPISITPNTNIANLNANIDVTGLPQGVHRLFIRSKDANGKWSITNFSVFDNSTTANYPSSPSAPPPISNMEYFIDVDPGFGNATPISTPSNSGDINNYSVNINLSGALSAGTHYLYIRSKQNPWSVTTVVPFDATATAPVTWQFIKAQMEGNNAKVSWATATETNTNKFVVEWSSDGLNFNAIGEVNAAGNSNIIKNYSLVHHNIVSGFNYYRIKQIDLDGSYKYSIIVKVLNNKNIKQTIVAPNPVKDVINIVEPKMTFIQNVELYDENGKLILRKNMNENVQLFSIPVYNIASGNYLLKINYKEEFKTHKIIKQ